MEKGQTSDDVSHFLKSAMKVKYFLLVVGCRLSKRKLYGLYVTIKILYDNRKYFQNNGLINLMQSTDILNHTPLDVYRDEFDVSKEKTILNAWTSNDYKNILMVRHLKVIFLQR